MGESDIFQCQSLVMFNISLPWARLHYPQGMIKKTYSRKPSAQVGGWGGGFTPTALLSAKRKVHKKKSKKKLTSVSFMYVCVAENAELLFFLTFFAPSQ